MARRWTRRSADLKPLVVFGTRPEIVKLVPVVHALHRSGIETVVCHTGQHETLGRELLEAADIRVDIALQRPAANALGDLFAGMIGSIGEAIAQVGPDAVLVQGDTASAAAGALAAFHAGVPVGHVEAGLRSGDPTQPWPEETYRRMIGTFAHWHFAPTPAAVDNLRREGVGPRQVHEVGNTVIDALYWAVALLASRPELADRAFALTSRFARQGFAVVTVHRREHSPDAMARIGSALRRLAEGGLGIVFPAHPRPETDALADAMGAHDNIARIAPLDYLPFIHLMSHASVLVTDSGGIQEEATALGKPVVVLRSRTERDEAVAAGNAVLAGSDADAIVRATQEMLRSKNVQKSVVFGDGKAAKRIAEILSRE